MYAASGLKPGPIAAKRSNSVQSNKASSLNKQQTINTEQKCFFVKLNG